MILATPRGFRDVLPEEARWRERIVAAVQSLFESWGYDPVETPTLEQVAVLSADHALSTTPFRFFDVDGNQLALRPDVTLPVARLSATRLRDAARPLRLRYNLPVFREEESLKGQAREFTQLGIESIGMGGPAADAEVIAIFAEALRAAGLSGFVVCVACVGVLRELVQGASSDAEWRKQVLAAYHASNWVRLEQLAQADGVRPAYGAAIAGLPHVHGDAKALGDCRELVSPLGCDAGLDDLEQTLALLDAAGVGANVRVDFSIMNSLDYYTGFVCAAYAPGVSRCIGSGGRYDNMLASYGVEEPAAGFAFGLETLVDALAEAGVQQQPAFGPVALVGGEDIAAAFVAASRLRERGGRVRIVTDPTVNLLQAAERLGVDAWEAASDGTVTQVCKAGAPCSASKLKGGEAQ